ncbi:hypothetical protein G6F65_023469 [Rhizopus arrhizus]|nr:hypothetical protein G6F65_023469 [Rhizopus arrhizus]
MPIAASSEVKAGPIWKMPSTPWTALARLSASRRSPMAISVAPIERATTARASSRTSARTATLRRANSGTTMRANLPVAPTTRTTG